MEKPLRRVMCSSACAAGAMAAANRAADRARRRGLVRRGTVRILPERVVGEQGFQPAITVGEAGLSNAPQNHPIRAKTAPMGTPVSADFGRGDRVASVTAKARIPWR